MQVPRSPTPSLRQALLTPPLRTPQVCQPGQGTEAAHAGPCRGCDEGTIDHDDAAATACQPCPPGHYVPAGVNGDCGKYACPPGTADSDGNPATPCVACVVVAAVAEAEVGGELAPPVSGEYQDEYGQQACKPCAGACPNGSYISAICTGTNNTMCLPCSVCPLGVTSGCSDVADTICNPTTTTTTNAPGDAASSAEKGGKPNSVGAGVPVIAGAAAGECCRRALSLLKPISASASASPPTDIPNFFLPPCHASSLIFIPSHSSPSPPAPLLFLLPANNIRSHQGLRAVPAGGAALLAIVIVAIVVNSRRKRPRKVRLQAFSP